VHRCSPCVLAEAAGAPKGRRALCPVHDGKFPRRCSSCTGVFMFLAAARRHHAAAVIAATPRPAQAGDRRLRFAHAPEVPAAHRAAGVRCEEVVLPRGRDVRVQRAVVRAVILHLRMAQGSGVMRQGTHGRRRVGSACALDAGSCRQAERRASRDHQRRPHPALGRADIQHVQGGGVVLRHMVAERPRLHVAVLAAHACAARQARSYAAAHSRGHCNADEGQQAP